MSLGDALYAELSAGGYTYEEDDEDYTLADALQDLGRGQSVRSLAAELGVARSTLRGWLAGAVPKRDVGPLMDVARNIRRAEDIEDRRDELLAGFMDLDLDGWIQISSEKPRRSTVPASRLDIDESVADDLIDAYLGGAGPGRLQQIFARAVGDKFYREALRSNKFNVISVNGWA